ncbi:ras-like protein rasb [Anaeramoeba ignava]|uniref:small monomeric GTPase n=1 Tax=Anaeramoeba ignava TaxID=1746090 RepID=A0A9Q0LAM7_ANAIG|nr:ras-like protein rasb [Anaeramoeba ignava]
MSNQYRIIVLGEGGVGKSAVTIQFLQNHFITKYEPTLEETFRKQMEIDSEQCILEIIDTAGQEDYYSMRERYIKTGEGFLLVYSIISKTTFDKVNPLFESIQRVKESDKPSDTELVIPAVLIGNKSDLSDQRAVTKSEGEELAKSFGIPFFETSAKTSTNIKECFTTVVREMKKIRKPSKKKRFCFLL